MSTPTRLFQRGNQICVCGVVRIMCVGWLSWGGCGVYACRQAGMHRHARTDQHEEEAGGGGDGRLPALLQEGGVGRGHGLWGCGVAFVEGRSVVWAGNLG